MKYSPSFLAGVHCSFENECSPKIIISDSDDSSSFLAENI